MFKKTLLGFCLFLSLSIMGVTWVYDAPLLTQTVVDRRGNYIASFNTLEAGQQVWVDNFSGPIKESLLQKEDRAFYWHLGFNPVSIAKALVINIYHGRIVRGGSTITQQLAKNLITLKTGKLAPRNLSSKGLELLLAVGLEFKHSKNEILNLYLNTVYLGKRNYGFGAASLYYFGKNTAMLAEREIDFLTSLVRSPNYLPCPADLCENISTNKALFDNRVGYHFAKYATSQSRKKVVHTSLDKKLQTTLEATTQKILTARASTDPKINAAVVVIKISTGEILAMVGSRDLFDTVSHGQFNAALALRQPGSTLKPFTYFAAFSKGYTPESLVPDEPISFTTPQADELGYMPQNFDRHFRGLVPIREALANSYNVPAVATLSDIGLAYYSHLLKNFGFHSLNKPISHYGLSLTLGSGEVTLLELTNAYAALSRGGAYLKETVHYVGEDHALPPDCCTSTEVLHNAKYYAHQITEILSDPQARLKTFGWNQDLDIQEQPVAVKTGTSYQLRDNWTVGYTSDVAVGVWVGHNDATPLLTEEGGTTGATGAAPVWHAVMQQTLRHIVHPTAAQRLPKKSHPLSASKTAKQLNAQKSDRDWRITSPLMNSSYRYVADIPRDNQTIAAKVLVQGHKMPVLKWFLNGDPLPAMDGKSSVWLTPSVGKNILVVEDENGRTEKISFEMKE